MGTIPYLRHRAPAGAPSTLRFRPDKHRPEKQPFESHPCHSFHTVCVLRGQYLTAKYFVYLWIHRLIQVTLSACIDRRAFTPSVGMTDRRHSLSLIAGSSRQAEHRNSKRRQNTFGVDVELSAATAIPGPLLFSCLEALIQLHYKQKLRVIIIIIDLFAPDVLIRCNQRPVLAGSLLLHHSGERTVSSTGLAVCNASGSAAERP